MDDANNQHTSHNIPISKKLFKKLEADGHAIRIGPSSLRLTEQAVQRLRKAMYEETEPRSHNPIF